MNIPTHIISKVGQNLYKKSGHPIKIIKDHILKYFTTLNRNFKCFENLDPKISTIYNFDKLLIPLNHPSRSLSDTYYFDESTVLRTHMTAHQVKILENGETSFLMVGDVYRKDEVDSKHYPVFHQMDGVYICDNNVNAIDDLKDILIGLVNYLFPQCEYRLNNDYFPFTDPSFEIEVKYQNNWLEILGCGKIREEILNNVNINKKGWAFGLGLERLAMILFNIPDIRYFWLNDERFLSQFKEEKICEFKKYFFLEPVSKCISFYIKNSELVIDGENFNWLKINDYYEIVRNICGDRIEHIEVADKFYNKKSCKYSITFRLTISSTDYIVNQDFLNKEANLFMHNIYNKLNELGYEIR